MVSHTSPGCARWLHTVTGDLARSTSGGSSAKVGTEMEWVELSGTRSEHMSFRWAKTPVKLWEKIQNKSSLCPQRPLTWKQSWTKCRSEDSYLGQREKVTWYLHWHPLSFTVDYKILAVKENIWVRLSSNGAGIKLDHRPLTSFEPDNSLRSSSRFLLVAYIK